MTLCHRVGPNLRGGKVRQEPLQEERRGKQQKKASCAQRSRCYHGSIMYPMEGYPIGKYLRAAVNFASRSHLESIEAWCTKKIEMHYLLDMKTRCRGRQDVLQESEGLSPI